MRVSTSLALGLVVACFSQWANAQGVVRDDTLHFTLDVYGEWTDNRSSVSGDIPENPRENYDYGKQRSFKLGIGPGIHLRRRTGVIHWTFEYTPVYQWWDEKAEGQAKSELTHMGAVSMEYRQEERIEITVQDKMKYIDDPDIYRSEGDGFDLPFDSPSADERIVRSDTSHFENRLDGVFKYRLRPRIYTTLSGFWRIRRFDEDDRAAIGDEDAYGSTLGLQFQQTPHLSYGVHIAYESFDRETTDTLESGEKVPMGVESVTLGVGGRYRISQKADITGSYGYQFVTHENDALDDREYPTDAKVELNIKPSARTRLLLGASFGVTEGYVYPYVSQEKNTYYAGLSIGHTQRFSTTYRAEYRMLDFEEKYADPGTPDGDFDREVASRPRGDRDGERNELFLRFGVNYRWNNNLTLTGYYSFEDVDSDVSESFSANTVGARASYRF